MRRSLAEVERKLSPEVINIPDRITGSDPESSALTQRIIAAAHDAKGINATALDVAKNFGLADYFVVLSGRSDRHVQGLANKIIQAIEDSGAEVFSVQGLDEGHWVVIDTVDVVVHIFYEPLRERYDLENLWLSARRVQLPQPTMVKREKVLA
ncbi:MAG: ribosome silencing factor [Proteobacteria bacterium]|nr:ribosome silencing factor [Pseudomonadota bacterium]